MRFLFLMLLLVPCFVHSQLPAGIDPVLIEKAKTQPIVEAIVLLKSQADLSPALFIKGKNEKGRWVFETLRDHAAERQLRLRDWLGQQSNTEYECFWLVNAIKVKTRLPILESLLLLEDVQAIVANSSYQLQPAPRENQLENLRGPAAFPWGITYIEADKVWDLGIRGQGVVVAGADTGVEWNHPALINSYRGSQNGTADHNYNWHDCVHDDTSNICGSDLQTPCDDGSHGTHTMGTVCGAAPEDSIGVAPDAKWIAVRIMDQGFGTLATYLEGFQWFIAPTDNNNANPDPDKAPDVINNSWYCSVAEGCNETNFYLLQAGVEALRAAGIVPVVSVGNAGNACSSANGPPGFMAAAFSVGAIRETGLVAGFSSRGPVTIDNSGRLKPDVVAPGTGTRSAVLNGQFGNKNGTSMAGPHVAGLVALLICANPALRGEVEQIETLIRSTALPIIDSLQCGGLGLSVVPNHVAGYGVINALAAVKAALALRENASVLVFPNPADVSVQLYFSKDFASAQVQIFDMAGRLCSDLFIPESKTYLDVSVAHLPIGMYVIRIKSETLNTSNLLQIAR